MEYNIRYAKGIGIAESELSTAQPRILDPVVKIRSTAPFQDTAQHNSHAMAQQHAPAPNKSIFSMQIRKPDCQVNMFCYMKHHST